MSRATADALIRNLKLLNTKERDHLMRLAYLGQSTDYSTASVFLSAELDQCLRELGLGLSSHARCVFAGMDYHLDWLFAAAWLAMKSSSWSPPEAIPMIPIEPYKAVEGIKAIYTDFRPITGSQEDIDLVVVYDDGTKLTLLFVEAKGSAAFNWVQLARKLIRLDRILVKSKMAAQGNGLFDFHMILAAPKGKKPKSDVCLEYVRSKIEKAGQPEVYGPMLKALNRHASGLGRRLQFLPISGFPEQTYAVRRVPKTGEETHWTLKKRP
ncbi:hypothetical protein C7S18_05070 [Ahniella affigens]|uniref:Uncharacterized protein n=1 Tax=Ahniella affigens TaxID=2021234 RepID=A0A2P1PP37_9GAMM|nr:hypothetical protein [Ahniella affigens]AVP96611.1 hypothetical protein C7S18_05070 [Ahniella affigens]